MANAEQRQPDQIRTLGQYRLIRELGQGGMGAVYLAEDSMMQREVALKILPKKFATDQQYLGRFKREAQAAGNLNHPNICGAYAIGEEHGIHYYVMEYCEGEALHDRLKRVGRIYWKDAFKIITDAAQGLKFAHDNGIVHRDIKPDNIFITKEGVVKILDMGLAKLTVAGNQAHLTQDGSALGTPHYISPEQARGETNIDGRSDIYSLGVTLFHLLTGEKPFDGENGSVIMMKHLMKPAPDPLSIVPDLPEEVVRIVLCMMAKKPEQRYEDCAALIEDLERVGGGLIASGPSIAASTRSGGTRQRRKSGAYPTRSARISDKKLTPVGRAQAGPREYGQQEDEETRRTVPVLNPLIFVGLGVGVLGSIVLLFLMMGGNPNPNRNRVVRKKPSTDRKIETEPKAIPGAEMETGRTTVAGQTSPPLEATPSAEAALPAGRGQPEVTAQSAVAPVSSVKETANLKSEPIHAPSKPLPVPSPSTSKDVYLADLEYARLKVPNQKWLAAGDNVEKWMLKEGWDRCVYVHANNEPLSEVTYRLPGSFKKFKTGFGCAHREAGKFRYFVFGDGRPLYASPIMGHASGFVFKELDISGVRELTLKTKCLKPQNVHTLFVNPHVTGVQSVEGKVALASPHEKVSVEAEANIKSEKVPEENPADHAIERHLHEIRGALAKGNSAWAMKAVRAMAQDSAIGAGHAVAKGAEASVGIFLKRGQDRIAALKGLPGKTVFLLLPGARRRQSVKVNSISETELKGEISYQINGQVRTRSIQQPIETFTKQTWESILPTPKPATPDAWMLEALLQWAAEDKQALAEALDKSKGHALFPYMNRELEKIRMGERAYAAQQAWDKAEELFTAKDWEQAGEAYAAFLKEFKDVPATKERQGLLRQRLKKIESIFSTYLTMLPKDDGGFAGKKLKGNRSIPMHAKLGAPVERVFKLHKKYSLFKGKVGNVTGMGPSSMQRYYVLGDGKELWSWSSKQAKVFQPFVVDVRGVHELKLVLKCDGSINNSWTTWQVARVIRHAFQIPDLPSGTELNK